LQEDTYWQRWCLPLLQKNRKNRWVEIWPFYAIL
jgi:hypothetical protein